MGGTRTFAGVMIFLRMAFKEYEKTHPRWFNPFHSIDPPQLNKGKRDALTETEVIKLFSPGVLQDTMELALCVVMFLSGLRRSEIFALRPECCSGSMNGAHFERWFEYRLLNDVQTGSTVIMDRASFYRKKRLRKYARKLKSICCFFRHTLSILTR
jgi:hypothetical protein